MTRIPNRLLTKNFSLHEMLISPVAVRKGIEAQFNPSPEIVHNIEQLCIHILQPLRDAIGRSIMVNSGYRVTELNKLIGGSAKSQHTLGLAADIEDMVGGNQLLFEKIIAMNLPFDQLINEFDFAWVHVSFDPSKNRKQILRAVRENGKTVHKLY